MSAWSTPHNLTQTLAQPMTQEQLEAERLLKEKRAREAQQLALSERAGQLCGRVERACETRSGGVSSNYAQDEQYAVNGTWREDEILLAFELWKQGAEAKETGLSTALNMHKMGPKSKHTGNRGGVVQVNFIRKITKTSTGRMNVHIDVK